ncbi:DNA-processing protein DprA [Bifidobacterium felsineum]|uniref:DNA-processing protein DprA n=1 Tax=Bifidobacterium felsineum TaxID=2045440 RepID=UPI001BDC7B09|nr:DNA-processing protein DprA [Bifidobacterium felsineum]MBT1163540.1 DNA-protecting protein DprA [Bifidobacterium felsineum]
MTNHSPMPILSRDALFRAALTFCLDGADASMYATLKGADNAEHVWHVLVEAHPSGSSTICGPAMKKLERMFIEGMIRWGRKPSNTIMNAFHTAVASWHNRMQDLPNRNPLALADWFTMDGTQWIVAPGNSCWPQQLDDLAIRSDWAPPLCIWGKGDSRALTSCDKPIGIVGSRDVTEYGRYVAHTLAEQAAASGHLVVSGGAMGTDAAAHWGALNALHGRNQSNIGRTVAVFAGGLNHMGPMRNRALFERIEGQSGALISELCPNVIPEARRFLLRNRIIAALSSTLVVAQARLHSGALNTAGWACELMREVYAAPGDINQPVNAGCNKIINEQKAVLLCAATRIEDICHEPHQPIMAFDSPCGEPRTGQSQQPEEAQQAQHSPQQDTQLQRPEENARNQHRQHSQTTANIPDLRDQPSPVNGKTQAIKLSDLPESQRLMAALIQECNKRHLITTPDALLRMAKTSAPDDITNIATVLEILGTMELAGIVTRKADAMVLSELVA